MPVVPYQPYGDQQQPMRRNYVNDAGAASPNAFGAQVGQALEGVGHTLQQAGDQWSGVALHMQSINNENFARETTWQTVQQMDQAAADFQTKYGKDAINHWDEFNSTITKLREQGMTQGNNPIVQNMIANQLAHYSMITLDAGRRHYAAQTKSFAIDSTQGQIDIAKASPGSSDGEWEAKQGLIINGVRDKAAQMGWSDVRTAYETQKDVAEAYIQRMKMAGITDAQEADRLFKQGVSKGILTGDWQRQAADIKERAWKGPGVKQMSDSIFSGREMKTGQDQRDVVDEAHYGLTPGYLPTSRYLESGINQELSKYRVSSDSTGKLPDVENLNPQFGGAIVRTLQRAPEDIRGEIHIQSGYRSPDDQADIVYRRMKEYSGPGIADAWKTDWAAAKTADDKQAVVNKYRAYQGDWAEKAPAAMPFGSNHQRGTAADMKFDTPRAAAWFKNNLEPGLEMPDWHGNDPDHVQLGKDVKLASNQGAYQLTQSDADQFKAGGPISDAATNRETFLRESQMNRLELSKALGRDPTGGELFAAHIWRGDYFKALADPAGKAVDTLPNLLGNVTPDQQEAAKSWTNRQALDYWKNRYDEAQAKVATEITGKPITAFTREDELVDVLKRADEMADKHVPGDPSVKFELQNLVRGKWLQMRAQHEREHNETVRNLGLAVIGGPDGAKSEGLTSIDQLRQDPKMSDMYNSLDDGGKKRILDQLERNAKGVSSPTPASFDRYHQLRSWAYSEDPAERKKFMDTDVGTDANLTAGMKTSLINMQTRPDRNAGTETALRQGLDVMRSKLDTLGITPAGDKESYDQYRGRYLEQIESLASEKKRPPTLDELRAVGDGLLRSDWAKLPGFWSTKEYRAYENMPLTALPQTVVMGAREALKKAGKSASDDDVRRYAVTYLIRKNQLPQTPKDESGEGVDERGNK